MAQNQNQSRGGQGGQGQGGQNQGGQNQSGQNQGSRNQGVNQGGGQGFQNIDSEEQRDVASQGGRAAHASGNANEFPSEDARVAGRKGGVPSNSGRGGQGSDDDEEVDGGGRSGGH